MWVYKIIIREQNGHIAVNLGRGSADRGTGFGGGQVGSAENRGMGSVSANLPIFISLRDIRTSLSTVSYVSK